MVSLGEYDFDLGLSVDSKNITYKNKNDKYFKNIEKDNNFKSTKSSNQNYQFKDNNYYNLY